MATVTKTRTYATGGSLTASNYNDDRDEIIAGVNNINNSQIVSGANIDASKINGTAVTLSGSETLANKTLTSPAITTPTITGGSLTKPTVNGSTQALATAADGATVTFDLSASNIHTVTLAGNRTLALSNVTTGQSFVIRLVQDGTGSRTVTWFTTIKWAGGSAPTLTTTASKTDVFGFICTSTGNYDGFVIGQNL